MASSVRDDEFDEYDKPGAERSRRRRGDEDLDSDLEGDLLEEDWLTARKNPSDVSDEELNDDLLQSDEEDENISGQGASLSLNATAGIGSSFDLHEQSLEDTDYTEGHDNLGVEDYEGDGAEGYAEQDYADHYGDHDAELAEDQTEYTGEQAEDEIYQDEEVLDIGINDPLDDEFQVDDYSTDYSSQQIEVQVDVQDVPESEEPADSSQIMEAEEMENETEQEEDIKEESDEEEDEDEESGRLRFKTERKDVTVVRLSDAASKRRNIPETLELSEEAKADLMEFEEKERQRRQGRFGGRGGRGRGGRGGRGGFPGFGMSDFRGDYGGRGRVNDQRPLMPVHMGMQLQSRMQPHHPQQYQPPPRGGFHDHGQQRPPPQPLLPPHLSHRSPPMNVAHPRPQMEPPRILSPPPAALSPQQPKNIHINPHFRGPASSPAQVPLMPAQNQPRPAVGPPRFPGPADFQQQHIPGNFSQPPRPHHPEPWRGPTPPPQEREPFFIGEPRFPGQHMFDQQSPAPLMNNNHPHPGQNPMAFNQSGPGFNQQGPQPMFQREPMRPNLPPPGPLGMSGMGQHGPPNPRHFVPHRPQFPQPGPPLPPQHMQFGMQQQPPHLHQHPHLGEPRPMMHHAQPPFRQQLHAIQPQQSHHRNQHPPPRASPIRPRMNSPSPNILKPPQQQMQIIPQRNSNLRELPVAPCNSSFGSPRPATTPAAQVRPMARPGQAARPMPEARGMPGARPQLAARAQPVGRLPERTVVQKVKKEAPALVPQPDPPQKAQPEDPDEDEETRLYRLKIEEQKRLREEILKRKELRRQMQAGMRKKELLERLSSQQQPQQPPELQQLQQLPPDPPASSNGTTLPSMPMPIPTPTPGPSPAGLRQNVKTRLQMAKPPGPGWPGGPQQGIRPLQPGPNTQPQWQQKKAMNRLAPNRPGPQFQSPQDQGRPTVLAAVPGQPQETGPGQGLGLGLGQPQELKPGVKRTVMQRANSTSSEGAQIPQKVRVVKLLGSGGEAADGPGSGQQQQQQQRVQQVPRQPPQLRQVPIRKVTMGTAPLQQHQPHKPNLQQLAPHTGRGGIGTPQQNRVVVQGRGRAGAGQMGRGRCVPNRQSPRVTENQPSMVSIEGLSSSTTDVQLKNLLKSIGPIQMFKMLPQQRKAIAKFINPQHASSFQQSFHRHMIDLSHIDVSLIDG
ncbi:hypothetical protein AGOR_G00176260 [Albula goreensis]|uniref:RRM domain-containing protein n=1 Tax=Albula goreensis TaxID=1534307 RepID=A0A8T3D0K3_9TELE|nr:hypothetical protein AGOR_G00176260 [Albula goreensis]